MKKIGIFSKTWLQWDESDLERGLGGSETWIVETSDYLQKNGYQVTVYTAVRSEHTSPNGVLYKQYENYSQDDDLDIAILSRQCEDYFNIKCDNIFLISHDMLLWNLTEEIYNSKNFRGIGVLSEWAKEYMKRNYPFVNDDDLFMFSNGYNEELYTDVDYFTKENSMVFSSQPERGLKFLITQVLPKITDAIPDFRLYVCQPNYCFNGITPTDNVILLGSLSKKELSAYQKRSKIWVYPNLGKREYLESEDEFYETFCITAVENAMAGNAIITNDLGGLSTTLQEYAHILRHEEIDINNREGYAALLADKAIDLLKNSEKCQEVSRNAVAAVKDKTWERVGMNLLCEMKRILFTAKAKFVLVDEYGRGFNRELMDKVIRITGRQGRPSFGMITSNNPNDRYCNDHINAHHYTTKYQYNVVFPYLCGILGCESYDLMGYFSLIENVVGSSDYSYLLPKFDKQFVVRYGKKEMMGGNKIRITNFFKWGYYDSLIGEQLNGEDYRNNTEYHKLFCLSHYTCIIENQSESNGRTLLLNGDSHLIPLVPIFAYFYKKVIYLDNRDYISYRWLWKDEEPDDTLFVMGLSHDYEKEVPKNKYFIHNFY